VHKCEVCVGSMSPQPCCSLTSDQNSASVVDFIQWQISRLDG